MCTGIKLSPQDGSIILGRTMEFPVDIHSKVTYLPKDKSYIGSVPKQKDFYGKEWKTKYRAVGMNAFDYEIIIDGINEKGLSAAGFYFPNYASFCPPTIANNGKGMAGWEFPGFLLGTCASVEDVKKEIKDVFIAPTELEEFGFAPPLHYVVHDADGACLVIEPINGTLVTYDNPIGVFTNSPTFDWHLINLSQYTALNPLDSGAIEIGNGLELSKPGIGAGLLGMPGDFMPTSRFVRATVFSQTALPTETAQEGILQSFHIMNNFDIPKGALRDKAHDSSSSDLTKPAPKPDTNLTKPTPKPDPLHTDYTIWTSASDLTNRLYYFHTYKSRVIHKVDLNDLLASNETIMMKLPEEELIRDLTKVPTPAKSRAAR